ncbi:unnamed protein product [Cunninghamella blakesleeana]
MLICNFREAIPAQHLKSITIRGGFYHHIRYGYFIIKYRRLESLILYVTVLVCYISEKIPSLKEMTYRGGCISRPFHALVEWLYDCSNQLQSFGFPYLLMVDTTGASNESNDMTTLQQQ